MGFDLQQANLPVFLRELMEVLGWTHFAAPQCPPVIPVVQEFYANVKKESKWRFSAVVRGVRVSVNPSQIHQVYGTSAPEADEFWKQYKTPTEEVLAAALALTAGPDARWVIKDNGIPVIPARLLTPKAHLILHFVKRRLSPTTHDSTVSKERILLVAAILQGIKLDIAPLIIEYMDSCASKSSGKLFFPSLITKLAIQARVPMHEGEERGLANSVINCTSLLKRFAKDSGSAPSKVLPASAPESKGKAKIDASAPPPSSQPSSSAPPSASQADADSSVFLDAIAELSNSLGSLRDVVMVTTSKVSDIFKWQETILENIVAIRNGMASFAETQAHLADALVPLAHRVFAGDADLDAAAADGAATAAGEKEDLQAEDDGADAEDDEEGVPSDEE